MFYIDSSIKCLLIIAINRLQREEYKAMRRKFNKVMNTIGKGEGISSKVEKEIQIAIDSGFDNPDAH